jgi:hypothetical protein
MNENQKNAFVALMYAFTKNAARVSFVEFLEDLDITLEEYKLLKKVIGEQLGVDTSKFYL